MNYNSGGGIVGRQEKWHLNSISGRSLKLYGGRWGLPAGQLAR